MHPKHPKKEINDALDYADQLGFVVEQTNRQQPVTTVIMRRDND